jgi:hypothetical protein
MTATTGRCIVEATVFFSVNNTALTHQEQQECHEQNLWPHE